MRVRHRNFVEESYLSTEELIDRGVYMDSNYDLVETLEAKIANLTRITACLIDMSSLSDQQVLEVTHCDADYTIVKD